MSSYLKFTAQVVTTAATAVITALQNDNRITANEWINVLILALGAVAVLGAGELPAGVWARTKTIVSAATAGAVVLQSALSGGVSTVELMQIALAVLGVLGVHAVPGPVAPLRAKVAAVYGKHAAAPEPDPLESWPAEIKAAATAAAADPGPTQHVVVQGDTLWSIAREVLGGNPTDAQIAAKVVQLKAWNPGCVPTALQIGQIIELGPPDLQAQLDEARAEIVKLQATVTGLETSNAQLAAQHQTDQQTISDQAAKIAELEAELHPTPAPPPPAPKPVTVFGVDVSSSGGDAGWVAEAAAQRSLFGGVLPRVRVFTTGRPLPWTHPKMRAVTVADGPVVSFKTWDPAAFGKLMDGIPDDLPELWACYRHEWEDDAKKSGNPGKWISDYLSVYGQMDAARRAHPTGHKVKLVKIMMWYQEVDAKQAGVTYKEAHGGQAFVDAIGWDCYWRKGRGTTTAERFLGPVVQSSIDTGLPWCVPELGVQDPAQRVALLTDCIAYARQHGALWVSYWNEAQWKLDGPALALWQKVVTS